jgi:putative Holliday junction resolvase
MGVLAALSMTISCIIAPVVAMKRYPGEAKSVPESSVDGSTETPGPWLAVDYGRKRVGIAISDSENRLAMPLCTLTRNTDRQLIREIARIIDRESVTEILVGEPRRLDGARGDAAERAERFARQLGDSTGRPWTMIDEALTSRAAEERLREAGIDVKRHPERIDQVAAQILLEDLIAQRRRPS